MFLFIIIAILAEYVVVLYAISLGVEDKSVLQWSFKFPGTDSYVTLAISPLFHLVPITVIIALLSSWTYLTKHMAFKPREMQKGRPGTPSKRGKERGIRRILSRIKSALSKVKGLGYLGRRIHSARATTKSALMVLAVFSLFILAASLLVNPHLIYQMITGAYQNNPALLNFVRGTGEALAPIGSVFSAINNGLLSASPGFRDFIVSLGNVLIPLERSDPAAKYLVFQNAAAWISAVIVLLYDEFGRKGYRPVKK
jgi:hypothetical protein